MVMVNQRLWMKLRKKKTFQEFLSKLRYLLWRDTLAGNHFSSELSRFTIPDLELFLLVATGFSSVRNLILPRNLVTDYGKVEKMSKGVTDLGTLICTNWSCSARFIGFQYIRIIWLVRATSKFLHSIFQSQYFTIIDYKFSDRRLFASALIILFLYIETTHCQQNALLFVMLAAKKFSSQSNSVSTIVSYKIYCR